MVAVLVSLVPLDQLRRARASEGWTAVPGRVVSVREDRRIGTDARVREVQIRYRYSVAGRAFEGTRISFAAERPTAHDAARIRRVYPQGAEVEVFVDPRDPGVSVLEPGLTTLGAAMTLGGYGIIVVLAASFAGLCLVLGAHWSRAGQTG